MLDTTRVLISYVSQTPQICNYCHSKLLIDNQNINIDNNMDCDHECDASCDVFTCHNFRSLRVLQMLLPSNYHINTNVNVDSYRSRYEKRNTGLDELRMKYLESNCDLISMLMWFVLVYCSLLFAFCIFFTFKGELLTRFHIAYLSVRRISA